LAQNVLERCGLKYLFCATAIRNGWQTIVPKFHVANCETIQNKKRARDFNGKYVSSNEIIEMEDLDGLIKELDICGYCVKNATIHCLL
jgi:hypothetical protein